MVVHHIAIQILMTIAKTYMPDSILNHPTSYHLKLQKISFQLTTSHHTTTYYTIPQHKTSCHNTSDNIVINYINKNNITSLHHIITNKITIPYHTKQHQTSLHQTKMDLDHIFDKCYPQSFGKRLS